MGGWMDGWVDGWMDGWVDGWMDGGLDGWVGRALRLCVRSECRDIGLTL
jgi:hypothetical protein